MVQNTNEALSKYQLKVHNTNKLKRVKFLQFKIPTGWYYEHSVHNTNYNCCHGCVELGGGLWVLDHQSASGKYSLAP